MATVRRSLTPYAEVPSPEGHPSGAAAMRRNDPRIEASQRLALMLGDRTVDGWTLNASRGGIRVIAEAPLELGDEIHVRVGDDGALRPGRVVWVQDEPDGCIAGIAWLDVVDAASEVPPAK